MKAADLLFPRPFLIREKPGRVTLPACFALQGALLPAWLRARLARACHAAGIKLAPDSATRIRLALDPGAFSAIRDERLRPQAYTLTLGRDGCVAVTSPAQAGLQSGLITLCQLLEAAGAGGRLAPMTITDRPAFAVRGFQVDTAREYLPSVPFLKGMIDRAVDLKFNTLWLYLENRFVAPGLEDLSPPGGLTPAQARALSAYATARGIDLVPGTNVLSHMEGWFRLERYTDFADGASLSYPVLTDPRAWTLVRGYLDALAEAFPSPNFHAGLDELLFTGTNPAAAKAIAEKGKARYFADFARKVIDYLQSKGKTVWMWDDMVMGKNVFRPEGFNDTYRQALHRIPKSVVMTHWYYWTDSDGKHGPILQRVAGSKRPFVVAPSAGAFGQDYGSLRRASENQSYMAECGLKNGAFGLVNTHWESRYGTAFLSSWPLLALAAGYAWSGGGRADSRFLTGFSFALCGDTGSLADYLETLDRIQDLLGQHGVGPAALRGLLFLDGPHMLWRRTTSGLTPAVRRELRSLIARAWKQHAALGTRDPLLKKALALGPALFEEGLAIIDAFDDTWGHYHRAAGLERKPGSRAAFKAALGKAGRALAGAKRSLAALRDRMLELEKKTGHTAYDAYALGEWIKAVDRIPDLIREAAEDGSGLPAFEKLLYLPRCYYESNLTQLRVQNTFHNWFPGTGRTTPPPVRWK
jgi:hypothetical protein